MAVADLHVNITWESEPTEEAKAFVKLEVLKALKEAFEESGWFAEMVEVEVKRVLQSAEGGSTWQQASG